jgi:hypothetical protein
MASPKDYTLRLELWKGSGEVVGEVEVRFSEQALRGLVRGAASPGAVSQSGDARRETESEPRTPPKPFRGRDDNPTAARGDERAMSTEQRKFLFRLVYGLGFKKEAAEQKVLQALGVERLEWATRSMASRGIDALKEEMEHRPGANGSNGSHNGRANGAHHG